MCNAIVMFGKVTRLDLGRDSFPSQPYPRRVGDSFWMANRRIQKRGGDGEIMELNVISLRIDFFSLNL